MRPCLLSTAVLPDFPSSPISLDSTALLRICQRGRFDFAISLNEIISQKNWEDVCNNPTWEKLFAASLLSQLTNDITSELADFFFLIYSFRFKSPHSFRHPFEYWSFCARVVTQKNYEYVLKHDRNIFHNPYKNIIQRSAIFARVINRSGLKGNVADGGEPGKFIWRSS